MENKVTITLSQEQKRFIQEQIDLGRYHSVSDVVRDSLSLLETQNRQQESDYEAVRQKIAVGLDQVQRGEVEDGEVFFAKLMKKISK